LSDVPHATPATARIWFHTYQSFADALGINLMTVKRKAKLGEVRTVHLSPRMVRCEPPEEYMARLAVSGPEPKSAK
jgi:hypothetical protein